MPDWRIYYSDGSTFDNDQGAPQDAPSYGVQVVIVKDGKHGRRVLKLCDFYLWRPSINRWTDHIDSTSAIMAAAAEPWVVLVCGQYLLEDDFERILIRAYNDPDFPGVSIASHEAWRA